MNKEEGRKMTREEIEESGKMADDFFEELMQSKTNPGPAVYNSFVNSLLYLSETKFTREELHDEIDGYIDISERSKKEDKEDKEDCSKCASRDSCKNNKLQEITNNIDEDEMIEAGIEIANNIVEDVFNGSFPDPHGVMFSLFIHGIHTLSDVGWSKEELIREIENHHPDGNTVTEYEDDEDDEDYSNDIIPLLIQDHELNKTIVPDIEEITKSLKRRGDYLEGNFFRFYCRGSNSVWAVTALLSENLYDEVMEELSNEDGVEMENKDFFDSIMVNGEEIDVESYTPNIRLWQDYTGDWGIRPPNE